jgi:hypothetical protein
MKISQAEYEERRHVFEFNRWINQKLFDLQQLPKYSQIYFERKGSIKKLLEEAVPVARLGLYFCKPWRDIFIQCFVGNQPFDATLEIQDPTSQQIIKVEACTTETDRTTMQRQSLSRKGFVYFTGPIVREGNEIISKPEFEDVEVECERIVQLAIQRLESKLKNKYDDTTAILIYVTNHWKLYPRHRFKLIEEVRKQLMERTPSLYGVFICYTSNLGVDGILNSLQEDFVL